MENKGQTNKSLVSITQKVASLRNNGNKKARRVINVRKKKTAPFPLSVVLGIITLTLLTLVLMKNFAEVDKYNAGIADIKSQLTDLQNEADKLEERLNKKNNLVYIEEYAEAMGMVKSTELQRINVTLVGSDEGDIYKYEDGNEGGIGVLFSSFGRVIRELFS